VSNCLNDYESLGAVGSRSTIIIIIIAAAEEVATRWLASIHDRKHQNLEHEQRTADGGDKCPGFGLQGNATGSVPNRGVCVTDRRSHTTARPRDHCYQHTHKLHHVHYFHQDSKTFGLLVSARDTNENSHHSHRRCNQRNHCTRYRCHTGVLANAAGGAAAGGGLDAPGGADDVGAGAAEGSERTPAA